MKTVEEKRAQLFASLEVHQTELSACPLSDAEMEAVAMEEAQKLVDLEIQEIDRHINNLITDVLKL